jgi:ATP-dependent DNA ligase
MASQRRSSTSPAALAPPQEVMLAHAADTLPREQALPGGCWYEPKWDGYRALVFVTETGCYIQSRHGKDLTRGFPEVAAAARQQLPPGAVLDGELVVWSEGRLDFTALQKRALSPGAARAAAAAAPAAFVAFDVLQADGKDLRQMPLTLRRRRLESVMERTEPPLQMTPYTQDVAQAQTWMQDWAQARVGIEGVVVKGVAQPYLPGRRDWVKVRIRDTADAVVGAVTGTLARPDRLVLGLPGPDGLIVAGGTAPLNDAQRGELAPLLRPADDDHPWPSELPRGRTGGFSGGKISVALVVPDVVVEVSADTAFEYGKWRHLTQYVRVRADLEPEDVRPPAG